MRNGVWGLQFNDLVVVQVSACNINGCGAYSEANSVGVRMQTEPVPITTLYEGNRTNEMYIEIKWAALSGNDIRGADILSYHL